MITPEQEQWLSSLRDDNRIEIYPFDPTANEKFEKIKKQIQSTLGKETRVVHRGATSLGISGQGELDVYIPASPEQFNSLLAPLENIFGKPGSIYPLERVRFVTSVDGTKIEVFVINEEGKSWIDGCRLEKYLKAYPEALDAYEKLKESGAGLSTQQYYRRKVEFINDVLSKVV